MLQPHFLLHQIQIEVPPIRVGCLNQIDLVGPAVAFDGLFAPDCLGDPYRALRTRPAVCTHTVLRNRASGLRDVDECAEPGSTLWSNVVSRLKVKCQYLSISDNIKHAMISSQDATSVPPQFSP